MNPRRPSLRRRRLVSLKRLILALIQYLWFLTRISILTLKMVDNIIPLPTKAPRAAVSSVRRQDTLSVGTSLTPVSSAMHLTLKEPRSTFIDAYT